MPDFVATLVASLIFCLGLMLLNAGTRLALQWYAAPADLAENGMLQYGLALAAAATVWRRTVRGRIA
ncbi:MAG: hypothetical protein Q7T93_04125 [Methylobacterium sp.]|uniref:hypothetical protein n=1 Tax=unclassified Methylobacterium TaxID=2615210 RepID=UPI0011C7F17D|nr:MULTISPECIES: hypothetical protein [unclassified Methylobacterium]MDO9425997.1 hypothetical protein [Methylobacterium sp.]TXM75084.1 hypothetical protein FV218_09110 [Methylobacterium sp. WL69]